jgi:hypothetical protein
MIRITEGRLCFVRNAGVIIARRCANSRRFVLTPSAGNHFSRDFPIRANSGGSTSSAPSSSNANAGATVPAAIKYAKTTAGTGDPEGVGAGPAFSTRGPVTWPALGLVAIAAASAVGYYKIERERRLENAMGKIVSLDKSMLLHCTQSLWTHCFLLSLITLAFNRYQVSLDGVRILNCLRVGST